MPIPPLAITITPDLSTVTQLEPSQVPILYTITNDDDRDIVTCYMHCIRAVPGTEGWLEARIVGNDWAPLTDLIQLDIGAIASLGSVDFEIRLDAVSAAEANANFILMIDAADDSPPSFLEEPVSNATPLSITITPDLSVVKWYGRNLQPTVFTVTNTDTRDLTRCAIYAVRGDFLPKGAGRDEKTFLKKAIGEDLITDGWLEARLVDGEWAPLTDTIPLELGYIWAGDSIDFEMRLNVPDTITNEGRTNFALMVAATAAYIPPPPLPVLSIAAVSGDLEEGNTFEFEVYRDGDTSIYSSVEWEVTGSGLTPATADDFVGGVFPSGLVEFEVGETVKTILIETVDDTGTEDDEQFVVTIYNPYDAELDAVSYEAYGIIINNDECPIAGVAGWYDVSDNAAVQLSGNNITGILDKSGNGYNLYTVGAISGPSRVDQQNGLYVATYNGTKYLQAPQGLVPLDGVCTLYAVFRHQNGSTTSYEMLYDNNTYRCYFAKNSTLVNLKVPGEAVTFNCTKEYHSLAVASNGVDSLKVYIDGVLVAESSGDQFAMQDKVLGIGGNLTGANYLWMGNIAEMMMYHAMHTPEEVAENEQYLTAKWGL